MTELWKLTDENWKTRVGWPNMTRWGPGITHEASRPGYGGLCGPGWVHAYTDPLLAVLLNPVHAGIEQPVLWRAEGEIGMSDGAKVGCLRLTTLEIVGAPVITTAQRVRFGILCAMAVYAAPAFAQWAGRWLNGEDRSMETACRAVLTAGVPAALCAVYAAACAASQETVRSVTWAARVAIQAAEADKSLSLVKFAHQAMKEEK